MSGWTEGVHELTSLILMPRKRSTQACPRVNNVNVLFYSDVATPVADLDPPVQRRDGQEGGVVLVVDDHFFLAVGRQVVVGTISHRGVLLRARLHTGVAFHVAGRGEKNNRFEN